VPRAFEVFKFGSEEEDRAGEHAANVGIGLDDVVAVGPSSSSPDPSSLVDEDSSIITLFRWPRHIPATSVSIRGSFDGWKSEVPLTRSSDGSDWSTAIPLPCGKVYFKFIVDGRYVTSPSEPVVNDEEGKFNNLRVVHASARFHWPTSLLGGEQVQVDLSDAGFGCGGDDAKLLTMRLVERRLSAFSKTTSKSHELEVCRGRNLRCVNLSLAAKPARPRRHRTNFNCSRTSPYIYIYTSTTHTHSSCRMVGAKDKPNAGSIMKTIREATGASDQDIQLVLKECNNDVNEAVARLIDSTFLLDWFFELANSRRISRRRAAIARRCSVHTS